MNGNDESAALLQLSGGSNVDVDEPAAITSTSSSNTNTVGTTTTAREDVSASIPNEDAHISDQQLLEIGQDTLLELIAFCQSDSLTEQGLRERWSHLDLEHTIDYSSYDILLLAIFCNKRVTCGIVQFFLRRFPAPAGYIAHNGVTPLHALCLNKNATIDIVRCVIEGNPGALVAQTNAGRTPLVLLCMNKELDDTMSEKILKFILFKCPESARKRCTQRGHLPIEYALLHRSPKFCCLLIEAYPYSDSQEDESVPTLVRRTVRILLFSQEVDDRVALVVLELLLYKYPEAMRRMRIVTWSLLHLVTRIEIPRAAEICRLVIQALPELVFEHDENGLQPLHLACLGGNSPVVKCILEMRPNAIRGATRSGAFPIHYAVYALCNFPEAAVEMVKALLAVDHEVASQVYRRFFPLFMACTRTNDSNLIAGLVVIKSLYDAYPEAIVTAEQTFREAIDRSEFHQEAEGFLLAQFEYAAPAQASDPRLIITQDEDGLLPLHRALLDVAPLGSIKLLAQADPATLLIPNNEGYLPLHVACERYQPDVVKYLVDLNIRSLRATNNRGDTPLHCACRAANYGVIELLLTQTYPTAPVGERNVDGELPIQLLLEHDDQQNAAYVSCIFLLLRASPGMWMNDMKLVLASSN